MIQFKTEDGYRFFLLQDGRVVDSLDPESIDMESANLTEFFASMLAGGLSGSWIVTE